MTEKLAHKVRAVASRLKDFTLKDLSLVRVDSIIEGSLDK